MRKKLKLVFLYRWSRRRMGSSIMRIAQMVDHMRHFHGDQFDVVVRPISRARRPLTRAMLALDGKRCVYIFSKDAMRGWRSEDFEELQRDAAAVLVDYVDLKISEGPLFGVDVHIATSSIGARALKARQETSRAAGLRAGGEIVTILHNYDQAFTGLRCADADTLKTAFLGSIHNAPMTPQISERVDFFDASTRKAFLKNAPEIARYNCHYCVRPPKVDQMAGDPERSYRPFTKGITAAALGAVVFVNEGVDDAVDLLGGDYPFLARNLEPSSLNEGFAELAAKYGGPVWKDAQDRMAALHARSTHQVLALELAQAIQTAVK